MQNKDMDLQVGVKVIIKNSSGKYLILKRSSEKYPEIKNLWDIVGGRINPGDSLLDNLRREIEEETQLKLEDEKEIKLIYAQDIICDSRLHVVRLTYFSEIDGELALGQENIDYKWLSLEDVKSFEGLDEYAKEAINMLQDK